MNEAYVSLYRKIDNKIHLSNGFSFVSHKLTGKHIVLDEDVVPDKNIFDDYDKIYCTVTHPSNLLFLEKIYDKRWVFGGPLFTHPYYSDSYINQYFPHVEISRETLEKYFNIEKDDYFTPYWSNLPVSKLLCYSAMCGTTCYWRRCSFCRTAKFPHVKDLRDIEKVYNRLPEYEFRTQVDMRAGSITKRELEIILRCYNDKPKKNTTIKIFLRGDIEYKKVIERFEDLSGFVFVIGLESFSQQTLDKLNKGTSLRTTLNIANSIAKRNGNIFFTIISAADPTITEEILKESVETVKWIGVNIPTNKAVFHDGYMITWPTEEHARHLYKDFSVTYQSLGERFVFAEKYILHNIPDEKLLMCAKPVNLLREYGFTVHDRFNLLYKKEGGRYVSSKIDINQ
jgi:hypothetical protein